MTSSVVPASVLEKIRSDPMCVFADSNTVVLGSNELARIKNSSVILSIDERLRLKQGLDEARQARLSKARARKQRMLELENLRKTQASTMSEMEQADARAREVLLQRGRQVADEQHDDVKRMNQMVLYAKCVTIRDKQVQQTGQMKSEREEQEKLLDLMMEYERQKIIAKQRKTDRERVLEQKRGAQTIVQQMHVREKQRLREQELKTQEGINLLKQSVQRDKQVETDKQEKQKRASLLLADIVAANQEQAQGKIRRKQADHEEDLRIAAYLKEKERRETERDNEQARITEAKEKQKSQLIEARAKANDHQAEIDALRARRAHEETERKWRNQQASSAKQQATIQSELAAAREFQRMEKERKMIEQARLERAQFQKMLDVFQQQDNNDKQRESLEKKKRADYARVLQEQITELEARRLDRAKVIDMGEVSRREEAAERMKLESILAQKIAELQKAGVPPKYQAELKRFKVLQSHSMS